MRMRSWKTGYPGHGGIHPKEYRQWSDKYTNGEIIAYVLLALFFLCGVHGILTE